MVRTTEPGQRPADRRDAEIERLRRERDDLLARERHLRAELEESRNRLANFTSRSKAFAPTMRRQATDRRRYRRRTFAQYQIGRALEDARSLIEIAPKVFDVLGEGLGWEWGVLWQADAEAGTLRCEGSWGREDRPIPETFTQACRDARFAHGEGLPGRVWATGEVRLVEDVRGEGPYRDDPRREALLEAGLEGSLALPIRDGDSSPMAVFELFCREAPGTDEDLVRSMTVIGKQLGQFVERKLAEEEREELRREAEAERARLEAVLQQMPGGVFIADPSGRFTLANEGATRIHGRRIRSIEECGRYVRSYPDGEDIPPEHYPLNRALAGETISDMECYVLRADGARGIISANAAPVRDRRTGRILAAVKAFQDITPRKEAEEALRESEERLRTVVTGAPVILFTLDKDGVFTLSEGRGLGVLGVRPDEVVGRSIFEVYANYPDLLANVRRALSGESFAADVSVGGVVFDTQYGPIHDEDGEVTGIIGIATDVTERQQAEEERDRFFDLSPDLLCITSLDGYFKRVNPAFEETLGYATEEFFERPFVALVHPEDREETLKELGKLQDGGSTLQLETRVLRKNGGQRWMLWTAIPVIAEGAVYKAGRDITELKKAEEERERSLAREWRSRAQAEERKRLSRELHDRVAHSIAVVHQSLELHEALKERNPTGAESRMDLAREMTREALHYTRDLSNKLRNPEVEGGLSAALSNLLSTSVPPHVSSELRFEGDETLLPPRVREQLFLILREGVRNAVAHSEASRLTVGVDVIEEGGVVMGCVEDDGRGFDRENGERPGDRRSGGGLRSMPERAQLVGGNVELKSAPGTGTRVEVTIPLGSDEEAP